jgi:uncharacterized protein (DUF433 family)
MCTSSLEHAVSESELLRRVTIEPGKCGGKPCIRGMRIRVGDVLDLLAAGLSSDQIVQELPDLEPDDVRAALAYAARRLNYSPLAA